MDYPSYASIRGLIPYLLQQDSHALTPAFASFPLALDSCQSVPNPSYYFSKSAYLLPLPCIHVVLSTLLHASSFNYESKQMSSMESPTPCQPSSTDTNQYLVITVHVLVAVGISYLLRLLYQLITWLLFSHRCSPDERDGESPSPSLIQPLDFLSECKDLTLTMLVSFNSISRRKCRH